MAAEGGQGQVGDDDERGVVSCCTHLQKKSLNKLCFTNYNNTAEED